MPEIVVTSIAKLHHAMGHNLCNWLKSGAPHKISLLQRTRNKVDGCGINLGRTRINHHVQAPDAYNLIEYPDAVFSACQTVRIVGTDDHDVRIASAIKRVADLAAFLAERFDERLDYAALRTAKSRQTSQIVPMPD